VLKKVTETLDVPLSELAAEAPVVAATNEEAPGTAGLRLVLSGAHSLHAMLHATPVPPTDQLKPRVDHAWELTHQGRYVELTELLRGLVPTLENAVRSAPAERQVELCPRSGWAFLQVTRGGGKSWWTPRWPSSRKRPSRTAGCGWS
jgi:hypothetical protein